MFEHPEELIAREPSRPSRVMWVQNDAPVELTTESLLAKIPAGDVLVVNDTRVLKRRVFAGELEILFLETRNGIDWEVLFPSRKFTVGDVIELPEGRRAELVTKGRPQVLRVDRPLDEPYFARVAEIPLPPYIQKARARRRTIDADEAWYQTAWARQPGSLAAPTASLHFSAVDLDGLRERGVEVVTLTLHVGLGTFLPVTVEDLDQHVMHEEFVRIPAEAWRAVLSARARGGKIWALGTTVTRSLESAASGLLAGDGTGGFSGGTDLLIQPGHEFQTIDRLLTNFHQPQSTLLALVAAFAGLETTKACYRWAIERKFRLFSYGDLSAWVK